MHSLKLFALILILFISSGRLVAQSEPVIQTSTIINTKNGSKLTCRIIRQAATMMKPMKESIIYTIILLLRLMERILNTRL
jgi:hypothetical protein